MKQKVFLVITFFTILCNAGAQIKDFDIGTGPEQGCKSFYLGCGETKNGVIVFQSTIEGLKISMYPSSKIKDIRPYDAQCKEYVLCVDPTSTDEYRIEIEHPEYATHYYWVKDVIATRPQIHRINSIGSITEVADLIVLGDNHFINNRFSEAETRYREAYRIDPNDATVLFKLGETCYKQNKFTDAEEYMRKTVSLRANEETYYLLGMTYYAQSKYDDASFSFINAVELSSNKKYSDALMDALSKSSTDAEANAKMGDTYLDQGNYKDALEYFNKALEADPSNQSYPTKIRSTNTLVKQQDFLTAATDLIRIAQNTTRPTSSGTSYETYRQQLNTYLELYSKALAEVEKAKMLGTLPEKMQETAAGYEFIYHWEYYDGDLSTAYKKEYLEKYPNTPYRVLICGDDDKGCIENEKGEIFVKQKILRPTIGIGALSMGAFDLLGLQGSVGLRVFGCEKTVNLHIGLQLTYYHSQFYNKSNGETKPEDDKTWDIDAFQLSLPATLQFNLIKSQNEISPWAVFIAGTGQFNYNLSGNVFDTNNSDLVNRTGISTVYSFGFTTNKMSLSVFCRQNFNNLFIRDNILKYDNSNPYNDYKKLDKILENKLLFGAALVYSL